MLPILISGEVSTTPLAWALANLRCSLQSRRRPCILMLDSLGGIHRDNARDLRKYGSSFSGCGR